MGTDKKLNIHVPNFTKRDISNRVEELVKASGFLGEYPIDVERIIDRHLKLSIIPVAGLKKFHSIDAYITSDFTIIVDEAQYKECSVRYRFSLAHELAHYILHAKTYQELGISSLGDHVTIQNLIPNEIIKIIEVQAYRFAGCLLLPDSSFAPIVNELFSDSSLKAMTITDAYHVVEKLAIDFNVSKDVVQRQLQYYYPDLYRGLRKLLGL